MIGLEVTDFQAVSAYKGADVDPGLDIRASGSRQLGIDRREEKCPQNAAASHTHSGPRPPFHKHLFPHFSFSILLLLPRPNILSLSSTNPHFQVPHNLSYCMRTTHLESI